MEAGFSSQEEEEEYCRRKAIEEDRREEERTKIDYQEELEFRMQLKRQKKNLYN